MDGTKGVNGDEELNFLEFLHSNNQEIRDVKTIFLYNKVDNPSNEDILEVVNELKERVEASYGVSDRTEAFQGLLEGATVQDPFPIFLPFSAMHAFIYRAAEVLDFENFGQLGGKVIDDFGAEILGDPGIVSVGKRSTRTLTTRSTILN